MQSSSRKRRIIWIVVTILCIVSIGLEIYFYMQWKQASRDPAIVEREELEQIVAAIDQFMVLPSGEDPTLATVVDSTVLQDQPFFASAQNGDKVLIYTNARKAILYRPSTGQVVEVAPIYFQEDTPIEGTDTESS